MSANTPEDRALRVECLRIASSLGMADATLTTARDFYAFATGESDRSPRERINAVLDATDVR